MPDRLIRCAECGKEFVFTTGEQAFFRKKGFQDPHRCQSCRIRGKQSAVLKIISSEWKRDALKEKARYFYDDGEIAQLTSGEKYFVIGRKGAGKTAIADYINNINLHNVFSIKISFKNFPFNEIYAYTNDCYTAPNQYISIWKYVIYSSVCQLLSKNEKLDAAVLASLKKLYGVDTEKRLNKLIEKWTAISFNLEILGCGAGGERSKNETSTWIEKSEVLEDVIKEYTDDSSYFVLIDELDENYTIFPSKEDRKRYFDLITSLFKAIQDIKSILDDQAKVYPIVFLREDIFNLITDPDKNKWHDYIVNIKWDVAKIRNMLKHRLSIVTQKRYNSFDDAWHSIFLSDKIAIGNRQTKLIDSFSYIDRLSQLRPRDYIEYIRECADLALKRGEAKISGEIVKYNNREFSNYLFNEIRDEAHSALPEFDNVIALLPIIRKQVFSTEDFKNAYEEAITKGSLCTSKSAEKILESFFEYGIIGNAPKAKGKAIFRYEYPNASINHKEKAIIHRGLYGSLQIF